MSKKVYNIVAGTIFVDQEIPLNRCFDVYLIKRGDDWELKMVVDRPLTP